MHLEMMEVQWLEPGVRDLVCFPSCHRGIFNATQVSCTFSPLMF